MSEVYFKLDIKAGADDAVAGSLSKRAFARVEASRLEADAQRVIRSKYLALEDDVECFCLVFPLRGTFEYRQRGKEYQAGAGEVYVLNAQEAYEVDLSPNNEMLCLALPCDLLRPRIRNIDDLCGSNRFADLIVGSALRQLVQGTLETCLLVEPERVQDLCLDMAELMILPTARPESQGSRYSESIATYIVVRARSFIQSNLSNPELDVHSAAIACGVSVRQLQNAFQRSGTTFGAELLEQRLLSAHRMLRSTIGSARMIGDVAAQCGFRSQSHFSTRFRDRFGCSPRDEKDRERCASE